MKGKKRKRTERKKRSDNQGGMNWPSQRQERYFSKPLALKRTGKIKESRKETKNGFSGKEKPDKNPFCRHLGENEKRMGPQSADVSTKAQRPKSAWQVNNRKEKRNQRGPDERVNRTPTMEGSEGL